MKTMIDSSQLLSDIKPFFVSPGTLPPTYANKGNSYHSPWAPDPVRGADALPPLRFMPPLYTLQFILHHTPAYANKGNSNILGGKHSGQEWVTQWLSKSFFLAVCLPK